MLNGSRKINTILLGIAGVSFLASPAFAGNDWIDTFSRWTPSKYKVHGGSRQACPECFSGGGGVLKITNKGGKERRAEISAKRKSTQLKYGQTKEITYRVKFGTIPNNYNIIGQYKEGSYAPGLKFATSKGGKLRVHIRRPGKRGGKGEYKGSQKSFNIGHVKKNVWYEFLIVAKRHLTNGILDIYMNGKKIFDYDGGTTIHTGSKANFKFGLYRNKTPRGAATMQVDDFRVRTK